MVAKIDVVNYVREYRTDDEPYVTIAIRNDFIDRNKVSIEIEGKKLVFLANDLKMAIENATNAF